MNCELVLQRLLEEAPQAIDDGLRGNGQFSEHLAACPSCARQARMIVALNASLRDDLEGMTQEGSTSDAIRRAIEESKRRTPRRRRAWWGLVPLTAAAAIAGVLAVSDVGRRGVGIPGQQTVTARSLMGKASHVAVTAPIGTSVAVFETANPDIVVYWFYEEGTGNE